jgi:hypothetical protein
VHETEQSPRGPSRWADFPVRRHDKLARAGRQHPPKHRRGDAPRLLKRGGHGRDHHGSMPKNRLRGRQPPAGRQRRPRARRPAVAGARRRGQPSEAPGALRTAGRAAGSRPGRKDRSANGTSASVGLAGRIMRSNRRSWLGRMRPDRGGAAELSIHAQGRIFVVGADRP